jgi:CRISPR-associated protein Cmr6
MTFDKPTRPTKQPSNTPQKTSLATQKVVPNPLAKKVIPNIIGGGGNKGGGVSGGGSNGGNNQEPSPWLLGSLPEKIDPSASFVEYLRWMRSLDQAPNYKDATKTQILQMAQEGVNYQERLKVLNQRIEKIAKARHGLHFKVMCPWRMRVGGHRGPESILLPSFDALGVPYLPSSTLTGVARVAAIREFMQRDNLSWQNAEKKIAPYFGSIEAPDSKNRAGKVIFLDAYPEASKSAGLAMDMANSIWRWEGDRIGDYSPNPNPFFSLKDVTFVVGVCRMASCDDEAFDKVKAWLIKGLQSGVGSQINSGYGEALVAGAGEGRKPFLEIDFDAKGQGIHGRHYFHNKNKPFKRDDQKNLQRDRTGNLKPDTISELEVRSTAFKNMLRYWFRVFALGALPTGREFSPKNLESMIFGGISPQKWGWLCVRTEESAPPKNTRNIQSGILRLFDSSSLPDENREIFRTLCKNLTWLTFRLGGVGQGSRRPYYERNGNPRIRGCNLTPFNSDSFWQIPNNPDEFNSLFREHMTAFYVALGQLANMTINPHDLINAGDVTRNQWYETADLNCKIFAFRGNSTGRKTHALQLLHENKDTCLCGSTSKPSPVWIADAENENYQIVTVFGATHDPRKAFVKKLQDQGAVQIFPIA